MITIGMKGKYIPLQPYISFRYTALLNIQSLFITVKFGYLYIIKSEPEHSQPLQQQL
uniref:Uncharacterized protein n=1 Tax=Ciona intestinalis TaxID=7719 RepID=H2Y3R4_CIOIN